MQIQICAFLPLIINNINVFTVQHNPEKPNPYFSASPRAAILIPNLARSFRTHLGGATRARSARAIAAAAQSGSALAVVGPVAAV